MTDARLIVDPSSIAFRSSGPATGDITLLLDGGPFPSAGWNDFVLVVLQAWISALVRLAQQTSQNERVHFMEGPYAVDVGPLRNGLVRLRAIERPHRERALVDVGILPLMEDAMTATNHVLEACKRAGHKTADVDRLDAALAALSREASNLKS
jgi:hypothetical protein